jgi:hypothetical protein
MVVRRPLVLISGQSTELPPGDSVTGVTTGSLIAGSGLNGGGDLSATVLTNVSVAPNASGLIFVGNSLAADGVPQRTSVVAIASGDAAIVQSAFAAASGFSGRTLAFTAIASGNAVFPALNANPAGTFVTYTAASTVLSGYAVGLDDSGRVQAIGTGRPTLGSQTNFIGIAQAAASSGSSVRVRLPGSYDRTNSGLTVGALYYVNPTTSGITTTSTQPASWSGAVSWGPIGRAVTSTTLLLTDML